MKIAAPGQDRGRLSSSEQREREGEACPEGLSRGAPRAGTDMIRPQGRTVSTGEGAT